jgi:signal transduction histidine kinase
MRSLYLRIYLTVVAALALFALASGWLVQRHLEEQRVHNEGAQRERVEAWAELLQRSLPPADAPLEEQVAGLREWSQRLRIPMALDAPDGRRIGSWAPFQRRELNDRALEARAQPIRLEDGRTLWIPRQNPQRMLPPGARPPDARPPWWGPRGWPDGVGLAALLVVLFAAVAAGAWPVVRGLTRRLEALKQGVEAFGAGALHQRVAEEGRDEVASLAASFNRAAVRIEALLRSHQSLLANASHELRSPLARLKMAVAMADDAAPGQRERLRQEINTNIAELDALVEEVLLASRLDGSSELGAAAEVDLLALAAEEAARVDAVVQGSAGWVQGHERLLRRAVRNLLENARRYGGGDIEVTLDTRGGSAELRVCDRGAGVPDVYRERIFEAFFRLPGHAEREGGVGLGLALVRQIAQRHGGSVRCEARAGGGSCFVLLLPAGASGVAAAGAAVPAASRSETR